MDFKPFDYQTSMIDHLLDNHDACLFASPGLGKTVVTLTAISQLILEGAAKAALIVAPIRVCAITWPAQVARWDHTKWMRVANLRTREGQRAWELDDAEIFLINSEQLATVSRITSCRKCPGDDDLCGCHHGKVEKTYPGFVDQFIKGRKTIPTDLLVVDELSLAKNPSSARFNALRSYLHDIPKLDGKRDFISPFKRRWGLTGTPAPNSYLDLFAQIRLIDGGKRLGSKFTPFQKQYFESDYMGFKWTIREGAKTKIDDAIADMALVRIGEDYLDLPTCNTIDIEVNLGPDAYRVYRVLEKQLLVELEDGEIEALSAAALTTKLLQITAGRVFDAEKGIHSVHDVKIKALRAIRKSHPKEPLLVLTSYTHERDRILQEFPEARQFDERNLDEWQKGRIPMWVTDARSISHGIDGLQVGGRIAVWMTPTYSWETYTQTNARLVRTGQTSETIIYRILANNTIDQAVAEALRFKEEGHNGLMTAIKALQALKQNS